MRSNPFTTTLVVLAIAGLVGAVALAAGANSNFDLEAAVAFSAWSNTLLLVGLIAGVGALVVAGVRWQAPVEKPATTSTDAG